MKRFLVLTLIAAWSLSSTAWGDTVYLRDGTVRTGVFVAGDRRTITLRDTQGIRHRFDISNVEAIEFATTAGQATNPRDDSSRRARWSADRSTVLIPSGTELMVRVNETINSKSAEEGQTFSAQIDQDVIGDAGEVLIPRGSDTRLVIREASRNELELALQSITVDGRRYLVSTEEIEQKTAGGIGTNKRTAVMVGGGAALGTLLGAIAGGGKGALIGAIAGAVVGGTAQILTRGKEVRVPAETVLRFKLDQALRLEAVR